MPQGQSQNQQQSSATIQSPHFPWSQPTPQPLQEQREETQFFNVPQTSATATQPQQERGIKAPTIIDGVVQPRRQPPNDNSAHQEGGREEAIRISRTSRKRKRASLMGKRYTRSLQRSLVKFNLSSSGRRRTRSCCHHFLM